MEKELEKLKTENTVVSIPNYLHERLKTFASKNITTMKRVVEAALDEYLNRGLK